MYLLYIIYIKYYILDIIHYILYIIYYILYIIYYILYIIYYILYILYYILYTSVLPSISIDKKYSASGLLLQQEAVLLLHLLLCCDRELLCHFNRQDVMWKSCALATGSCFVISIVAFLQLGAVLLLQLLFRCKLFK